MGLLGIEEYILKRKKGDKLNEFDMEVRNENMRLQQGKMAC